MVEAVRSGQSLRAVAKQFGVSPATVHRWVHHASDTPVEQVRWEVDLVDEKVRVYGLRRAQPQSQPLLQEWDYRLPDGGRKTS